MVKRGRPSKNKIPSAYDYRRVIYLVQILQRIDSSQWFEVLADLAEDWEVEHAGGLENLLTELAKHTLDHSKQNWKGEHEQN